MNMDDKQKQIEEMAKDLEQAKDWAMGTAGSLNNGFGGWYGAYMYNQGYRKQSDAAREILDEVSQHFGGAWLVKRYKKYGVEVEE